MKVISLGLGVQSTWLYIASSIGILPKVDAAIFADTGREKTKTLEYLNWLIGWADKNSSIPLIVIQKKNLYADLLNTENITGDRFSSIPAYTKNVDGSVGMLRRQCTNEYKIEQVDKAIRELLGLKPKMRIKGVVEIWKGISIDEIQRMTIPHEKWKTFVYPFCGYHVSNKAGAIKSLSEYRMTRSSIINEYIKYNMPVPPKSSCVFCPYQSDRAWFDMKNNNPEDFTAAVKVDEAIRNSAKKGILSPAFLHDSCRPLKDIDFSGNDNDLWKGECSGTCHI